MATPQPSVGLNTSPLRQTPSQASAHGVSGGWSCGVEGGHAEWLPTVNLAASQNSADCPWKTPWSFLVILWQMRENGNSACAHTQQHAHTLPCTCSSNRCICMHRPMPLYICILTESHKFMSTHSVYSHIYPQQIHAHTHAYIRLHTCIDALTSSKCPTLRSPHLHAYPYSLMKRQGLHSLASPPIIIILIYIFL